MQYLLYDRDELMAIRWTMYMADCLQAHDIASECEWTWLHGIYISAASQVAWWVAYKDLPLDSYWTINNRILTDPQFQTWWRQ